ncbi:MAG: flagellar biosynthesis anti-sigma factor FlgM [Gemmatimonadetes bacterium]|nr:flagellar biosynthesis anti-sigma factor FlgM [Gemmatimonadota bacterium]
MKIGPRVPSESSVPLDTTRATEPKRGEPLATTPASTARVQVGDRVELSHAARTMAEATPLTKSQVEAIRSRIASGVYDDPRVLDVVASRILARGDV